MIAAAIGSLVAAPRLHLTAKTASEVRSRTSMVQRLKIGARISPEAGRGAYRAQYPGHIFVDPRDRLVPGEQAKPVEFRQQSAVGEREA